MSAAASRSVSEECPAVRAERCPARFGRPTGFGDRIGSAGMAQTDRFGTPSPIRAQFSIMRPTDRRPFIAYCPDDISAICEKGQHRLTCLGQLRCDVPQTRELEMTLAAVSLDDKYALQSGRVYLTGTQALVRLALMQRHRDQQAGLNTAAFISGYRGSPLGGFDQALWRAREFLSESHVHFQPGVNEDLGATAVWGSQQVGLWPGAPNMTASMPSGTARAPASTDPATSSSTETSPAVPEMAACSPWPVTTTPARAPPSRTSPSTPSRRR